MNIQQFLDEEKIHIYHAMDSFLTEYDTFEGEPARRSLERLNQDRHWFIEKMQLHDTRLINKVLDEVKREMEELDKNYLCGRCDSGIRSMSHTLQCNYKNDISTIIDNLKLK